MFKRTLIASALAHALPNSEYNRNIQINIKELALQECQDFILRSLALADNVK